MGIVLGLAAALCWGAGDLFVTFLARAVGTPKALLTIQAYSLLCWLLILAFMWQAPNASLGTWGYVALCGLLHVAGLVFTYRAFEIGTLSIVSPFASSFAIVTALCAFLAGERLGIVALGGAALLILGVIIVTGSSPGGESRTLRGVPEAIGSAISFGIMFWLADFVKPSLGPVWPLIALKLCALSYAAVVVWATRKTSTPPEEPHPPIKLALVGILAALADTLAWLAFLYGTARSYTTVVTALASLFSAFTVFLAWVFLKERLNGKQWVGVSIVLLGVLLVSL